MQRADAPAIGLVAVERARLRQRVLGIEMGEGLDVVFDRRDPVETGAGIFLGRHRAACDFGCGLRRRERGHVGTRQIAGFLWNKRVNEIILDALSLVSLRSQPPP